MQFGSLAQENSEKALDNGVFPTANQRLTETLSNLIPMNP